MPPAIASANGSLELRVVVDGGLIETFLGRRIAITSLVGLPDAPLPEPPHHSVENCTPTSSMGCRFESNCGPDPMKVSVVNGGSELVILHFHQYERAFAVYFRVDVASA